MLIQVLLVAAIGGVLCLDRTTVQLMFSRPVVAGPVTGLLLGDLNTGVMTGALLELIWNDRAPVGVYIPPQDTLVAILIAGAAILTSQNLCTAPAVLMVLSFLIILPLALLGERLDTWLALQNEKWAKQALDDASIGDDAALAQKHLQSILRTWLSASLFILVTLILVVPFLAAVYPHLPEGVIRGLNLMYGLIPLMGVAVVLGTVHFRLSLPITCVIFLIISGATYWLKEG